MLHPQKNNLLKVTDMPINLLAPVMLLTIDIAFGRVQNLQLSEVV
jgi:hypothetical protein